MAMVVYWRVVLIWKKTETSPVSSCSQSWKHLWLLLKKPLSPNYMDVSENSGTPKSSILIGFSIINHPFWGTTIFGNTYMHNTFLYITILGPSEKTDAPV